MAHDWYRKTTWTTEEENEFVAILQRARKFNRPQYLIIQASILNDTNDNELLIVALKLVEKYFNEYPDDKSEKSSAFQLKGNILYKMGKYDLALENYKNAIDFEKIYPQAQTDVYLDYCELVIQLNKTDLFGNVEKILLKQDKEIEQDEDIEFPEDKYVKYAILSIIYKHKNNIKKSNYYKTLAEEAANAEDSGFRWHKKLGLVKNRNKLLDKLME
jgi:tetratricopeptide (TPR) repeat protein